MTDFFNVYTIMNQTILVTITYNLANTKPNASFSIWCTDYITIIQFKCREHKPVRAIFFRIPVEKYTELVGSKVMRPDRARPADRENREDDPTLWPQGDKTSIYIQAFENTPKQASMYNLEQVLPLTVLQQSGVVDQKSG